MTVNKRAVAYLLRRFHLHRPAKWAYRILFEQEGNRTREKIRHFYSSMISHGDLVFDVGANVGNYAECFLDLGARVVAVEPNARCCEKIHLWLSGRPITVEEAAAGAKEGFAKIYWSNDSLVSSMSEQWISIARNMKRLDGLTWSVEATVPVVTLDSLISRHGMPRFIKVDVEGYEDRVLDGLSVQPEILSFEFNSEDMEGAVSCLEKARIGSGSLFNFVVGQPFKFECDTWVNKETLKDRVLALRGTESYGDIWIRK